MHTTIWRLKPLICKQWHLHTVHLDQMSNHATSKTSSCYIPKLVSVSTKLTRVPKHNWPMCDRLPSELLSDAGLMRWRSAVAWLTASSNPLDAWSVSSSAFWGEILHQSNMQRYRQDNMAGSSRNVTDHFLQETMPGLYNNLLLKTKTICTTWSVQNLDWSIIKRNNFKKKRVLLVLS